MDGRLREHLRRTIDETCRRRLGANLDTPGSWGLPMIAWEAAEGDPLLALCLTLDEIARQAVPEAA